jgi:hypothetical protein
LFGIGFLSFSSRVFAADTVSSGIATYVQITDKNVQVGDIIAFSNNGYHRSVTPYDPAVFGVVVKDPAVAFESVNQTGTYPVVSSGKVFVRVSTQNGVIKKGDLLTTSSQAGVAEKAVQPGYIIGTAIQDYTNTKSSGSILVVLNMGGNVSTTAGSNLIQTLKIAFSAPYVSPLNALRYVFAVGLVVLSFLVSVGYFGRVSNTGIEALGRNPLAGRLIIFSVILHLIMAFSIVAVGVVIAYLILVL